ncbi:Endoglucanase precursor [compost metagenome]
MVTMLMRGYEHLQGKSSASAGSTFKDDAQISSWAKAYVNEAAALGLISGRSEGVFQPRGITTRGEAAQVIYNLLNK